MGRTKRVIIDGMMQCRVCGAWKPIEEFTRDKASVYGYNKLCKVCSNKYVRERYAKKSKEERIRNNMPRLNFGFLAIGSRIRYVEKLSPRYRNMLHSLHITDPVIDEEMVNDIHTRIHDMKYVEATCKDCDRYPCYEGQDLDSCDCAKYGCLSYNGPERDPKARSVFCSLLTDLCAEIRGRLKKTDDEEGIEE